MVHARGAGSIAGDRGRHAAFPTRPSFVYDGLQASGLRSGPNKRRCRRRRVFFAKHYAKMDPPCSVRTGKREGLVGGGASSGERNFIREI